MSKLEDGYQGEKIFRTEYESGKAQIEKGFIRY